MDGEMLHSFNEKKKNNETHTFLGSRIKRGLYQSKGGVLINADINSSLNILRKFLIKNEIPIVLNDLWNRGCVCHPVIIRV